MKDWIKNNWAKIISAAVVICVLLLMVLNASGLKKIFNPSNYEKYKNMNKSDKYDYTDGDGKDTDMADSNGDKDKGKGDSARAKRPNNGITSGDRNQASNSGQTGIANGNGNENSNGARYTKDNKGNGGENQGNDTDSNGVNNGDSGNGNGNGGNNGGNAGNGNGGNSGGNSDNGNNGNGGNSGNDNTKEEPSVSWEDEQLKTRDDVMTKHGKLLNLSAQISKEYYVTGETFTANDAVVKGTFQDTKGNVNTIQLSYGGSDGYTVAMSTKNPGIYSATFKYGTTSTKAQYTVLKSNVQTKYCAMFEGNYYASTYPGEGMKNLLNNDEQYNSLINYYNSNYAIAGKVIDLSAIHSKMIAILSNSKVEQEFKRIATDSSQNVEFLKEENGYLTNILEGFRENLSGTIVENRSYVFYPASDWGNAQKNVIDIIKNVEPEYKIRLKLQNADDLYLSMGDQVFEGYTGNSETVSIPMGTTGIDTKIKSDNAKTLEIPESVNYIDTTLLGENFPNLQNYSYELSDKADTYGKFKIIDGMLCSKDGKTLLSVPAGRKNVTIPSSIEKLEANCFAGMSDDAVITFENSSAPEVLGNTGFNGTIKVNSSEYNLVMKNYMLAFANQCDNISFETEDGIKDIYSYNSRLNVLCYKDEQDKLAAVPLNIEGLYQVGLGITKIGPYAFMGREKITDIEIGNDVNLLCDNSLAFGNETKTITINKPGVIASSHALGDDSTIVDRLKIYVNREDYESYITVWSVTLDSVYGPNAAEKILTSSNSQYVYEDGVKYLKVEADGRTTYQIVSVYDKSAISIKAKEGTVRILAGAFNGCTNLQSIYLPDSVTEIPDNIFEQCTALETVAINRKVSLDRDKLGVIETADIFSVGNEFGELSYDKGVLYGINSDGTYTLIDVPTGYNDDLTVKNNTSVLYKNAFNACDQIKQFNIPDEKALTQIGESCFEDSKMLGIIEMKEYINLKKIGKKAFKNCEKATSLILPDGITEIPDEMCYGCSSLTKVDGTNVKSIGESAFYECVNLNEVRGFNELTTIGDNAFNGCVSIQRINISENVESVGESCFENCNQLQRVTINGKIPGISRYCFYGCSNLSEIVLGENAAKSIKVIGVQAFGQCGSLVELDLTDFENLENIGERAFENCGELSTVRLPENLKKIPDNCFKDCESLSILQLNSEKVPTLGTTIFGDNVPGYLHLWVKKDAVEKYRSQYTSNLDGTYGEGTTDSILGEINEKAEIIKGVYFEITPEGRILKEASSELKGEYTVPEDTIKIEDEAFVKCQNLTKITIPENAKTDLGNRCFKGCKNLTQVELLGEIGKWGDETFMDCTSLQTAIIGTLSNTRVIERIGTRAFKNCTAIQARGAVSFRCKVTTIGEGAFDGCSNLSAFSFNTIIYQSLENIEDYAFANCTKLSALLTSSYKGVKKIGKYAFYNCDTLKSPSIPENVETIGEGCFMECDNLQYVSFYGPVKEYPKNCFKNCPKLIKTGGKAEAFSALEKIGESAYEGCTSLTTSASSNWYLKNYTNLKEIGNYAFKGCTNLTDNQLSPTVTTIGVGVFDGCTSLSDTVNEVAQEPERTKVEIEESTGEKDKNKPEENAKQQESTKQEESTIPETTTTENTKESTK